MVTFCCHAVYNVWVTGLCVPFVNVGGVARESVIWVRSCKREVDARARWNVNCVVGVKREAYVR